MVSGSAQYCDQASRSNLEAPGRAWTSAGVRRAIRRALAETSRSAGGLTDAAIIPAAITGTPTSRMGDRHSPSQASPSPVSAKPQPGMCGTVTTAAGSADTVRPTQSTASSDHPMGTSATRSKPSGISDKASNPNGMTAAAKIGTATMLPRMK